MNLIKYKWLYLVISALVIVPGLFYLVRFGLRLGIDFTGGTLLEVAFDKNPKEPISKEKLEMVVEEKGVEVGTISETGETSYLFRMKPIDNIKNEEVKQALGEKFGPVQEQRFETVGPTISGKLSPKTFLYAFGYPLRMFGIAIPDDNITKAFAAVIWASIGILVYIAYSFRELSRPVASWKFGVAAIIALLHDVLLVIGIFAILGKHLNVEVDALFITALLTVMGFSVHDTIVIFDRIRENLRKYTNLPFAEVVNISLVQTLGRSLTTSFTVLFVLLALLLFGGTSIRWFVVALLAGIISGTYSSIFNAAPILVIWHEWQNKRRG